MAAKQKENCQAQCKADHNVQERILVDTRPVDGLRAIAALHVMLGHFVMYTDWTGERSTPPSKLMDIMSTDDLDITIDLMMEGSMGLFYLISGFVMVYGYGQVRLRPPQPNERHCCDCCNSCCCAPLEACCCRGLLTSDWRTVEQAESMKSFRQADFFRKRCIRLAPMYYITNILVLIMMLIAIPQTADNMALILFVAVISALGVGSWVSIAPTNLIAWTISTMAFFYMCFPSLVPRLQRLKKGTASNCATQVLAIRMYCTQLVLCLASTGLGFVVYMSGQEGPGLQIGVWLTKTFPPLRLPVFVMGCCCAYQVLQRERERDGSGNLHPWVTDGEFLGSKRLASCFKFHPSTGLLLWFLGTCVSGTLIVHFGPEGYLFHFFVRILLELLLPILFYDWILSLTDQTAMRESAVARVFATPLFAFFAQISMSLYLIHWFVLILVSYIGNGGAFLAMPWWGIFVAIPTSMALAWLLTHLVEKPLYACFVSRAEKHKKMSVTSFKEMVGKGAVGDPVKVENGNPLGIPQGGVGFGKQAAMATFFASTEEKEGEEKNGTAKMSDTDTLYSFSEPVSILKKSKLKSIKAYQEEEHQTQGVNGNQIHEEDRGQHCTAHIEMEVMEYARKSWRGHARWADDGVFSLEGQSIQAEPIVGRERTPLASQGLEPHEPQLVVIQERLPLPYQGLTPSSSVRWWAREFDGYLMKKDAHQNSIGVTIGN